MSLLLDWLKGKSTGNENKVWGCPVNVLLKLTLISQKGANFGAGSQASAGYRPALHLDCSGRCRTMTRLGNHHLDCIPLRIRGL